MATKTYKCANFANCDKALTKELIEIGDGDEFVCPSGEPQCRQKYLQLSGGVAQPGKGPIPKAVLLGLAMVIVLALAVFLLLPRDQPELAETLISDFFPRLR